MISREKAVYVYWWVVMRLESRCIASKEIPSTSIVLYSLSTDGLQPCHVRILSTD